RRRDAAHLQLPLRARLPRAARAARAAGGLHPRRLVRRPARRDGRLQRVAPRTRHARASPGVQVADAADAPDPSRHVPAVPARPDLLGRRARGRGLSRASKPPRTRRLRSPAGDGTAARAPARRRAVRPGRRASAGRVASGRQAAAPRRRRSNEAIAWYEELSDAIPGDPGVQVRLAVLYGEAGRIDEVLDTVERWRARGDSARADVLAAAYLDAPLDGALGRLRETAAQMLEPGWFRDRLLLRLADRAGDSTAREAIVTSARARTAP